MKKSTKYGIFAVLYMALIGVAIGCFEDRLQWFENSWRLLLLFLGVIILGIPGIILIQKLTDVEKKE